jgi:uncharacterized protein YvpB
MKTKTLNYLFGAILFVLLFAVVIAVVSGQKGAEREINHPTATDGVSLSVTQTLESIHKTALADLSTQTASASQPSVTPAVSPTPTEFVVPDSFYITGIFGSRQYFALGCEASAAADWADFFDVLIYEYDFQHQLPLSDNPDLGFVGDAKGPWGQVPPYAYGVHAEPVAALLREYGLPAVGGKGFTLEQVRQKISQSKPIIAWVIGNMTGGVPAEYTDKEGNKTIVAAYEHVVILTGYDQDSIRYMNNGKFYEVPNEVFLNSWGVLGNMAIMHE